MIVYGYSDDNTEFRGAIYDEAGAYQGTVHYIAPPKWLLPTHDAHCDCPFCDYDEVKKTAKAIKATWNNEGYSWTFKTDIPHATFDILEDGEKFCRGIVFEVAALKPN